MNKHEGCIRAFTHLSESWYGKACLASGTTIDSVTMGFYHPDGGTTGEFEIHWEKLAGRVTPRLEVFDDAWDALHEFRDVIALMAKHDGEDIGPHELCNLLRDCGIIDRTERSPE